MHARGLCILLGARAFVGSICQLSKAGLLARYIVQPCHVHRRSAACRLPPACTLRPEQGASHSRNRLLEEACGAHYAVFWDDDVEPQPGCLDAYVAAFKAHPDEVAFAGEGPAGS